MARKKDNLKMNFRIYLRWPVFMSILLIMMNVAVFVLDIKAGFTALFFVAIYLGFSVYFYIYYRHSLMKDIVEYGSDYAQIQKQLLNEMSVPYGMCDETGRLLWVNRELKHVLGIEGKTRGTLYHLIGDFSKGCFPGDDEEKMSQVSIGDHHYRLYLKKILMTAAVAELAVSSGKEDLYLYAVYLFDETEILSSRQEMKDNRLVAGLVYMDNYEEALENLEDVRKSLLVALVDRKITQYFNSYNCILKKLEKDKYLFVVAAKYLPGMKENRFSVLEDAKSVNIGNDMSITLSMGIGINGDSFLENYNMARTAIDLALGRGGDQAVIKDDKEVLYFGGKSHSMEKTTRVKARVKAHALRELIESKEEVLIMGHELSDVDSIGSAIGVYRATTASGKKAHIILDTVINSIRPLLERFKDSPDYPEDLFISSEKALTLIDDNTIVVVVDVNRPAFTQCPMALQKAKHIVVIDHHRQSNERIENAVLSYVEPYASSAAEMVAEILQYYMDGIRIKALDADAMYSGIVIDTNNFLTKTGIRTFEAAAFLRRNGADVTRVRKMFREDVDSYKVRAQAIDNAEVFDGQFAISICSGETQESINVVAAQAANELLNIKGIQASFVLAMLDDKVYISARSIDEINVQVIMEKLGGGGHMSVAGAQIKNKTIEEVKEMVIETVHNMRTEKTI